MDSETLTTGDRVRQGRVERWLHLLYDMLQRSARPGAVALLADAPGSLAERVARMHGFVVHRYPSRSLVERHGFWMEPWMHPENLAQGLPGTEQQTAFLDTRSEWLEYQLPVHPAQPIGPPLNLRIRTEVLADVLEDRNRAFVALNDQWAVAEFAASPQLAETRFPTLLLNAWGSVDPLIRGLPGRLLSMGYCCWCDGKPVDANAPDTSWDSLLAAHPTRVGDIADKQPALREQPALRGSDWQEEMRKVSLLSRSDGSSRWYWTSIAERGIRYGIRSLSQQGWHSPERCSLGEWVRPVCGADSRMLLPLPLRDQYLVDIHLVPVTGRQLVSATQVFLDGWGCDVSPGLLKAGGTVTLPLQPGRTGSVYSGWCELMLCVSREQVHLAGVPGSQGPKVEDIGIRWR